MPYYVRVFCKSTKIPTIDEIFSFANNQGYNFKLELIEETLKSNNGQWKSFEMKYREGKGPIIVELNSVGDEMMIQGRKRLKNLLMKLVLPGFL